PAAEAQAVQHDAGPVGGRAMSLTADEVRWVAHLARLQLTDAELTTMTRQLSAIVEYVDQLKQVNTDGVEPLAHALEVRNVFRADEPRPSLPVADALANAPARRSADRGEQFFGVPAVIACCPAAMLERPATELLA